MRLLELMGRKADPIQTQPPTHLRRTMAGILDQLKDTKLPAPARLVLQTYFESASNELLSQIAAGVRLVGEELAAAEARDAAGVPLP